MCLQTFKWIHVTVGSFYLFMFDQAAAIHQSFLLHSLLAADKCVGILMEGIYKTTNHIIHLVMYVSDECLTPFIV